jgi:2-haloacid dehalogenase
MDKPSIVVFDLGKVLLDFDYGITAGKLAARCSVSHEQIKSFINQSPLLFKYETGLVSTEQFYREVCGASGFCGDIEEFSSFFADIFTPIPPMVQLHAALRQAGFPTYIFSNTNELAIRHIRRNFPFFSNFDGYVFSYEHEAMKPEAKIYEVVEKISGHRGPEILYIDDRPENTAAGTSRGWRVILQESPEQTWAVIRELQMLEA